MRGANLGVDLDIGVRPSIEARARGPGAVEKRDQVKTCARYA